MYFLRQFSPTTCVQCSIKCRSASSVVAFLMLKLMVQSGHARGIGGGGGGVGVLGFGTGFGTGFFAIGFTGGGVTARGGMRAARGQSSSGLE